MEKSSDLTNCHKCPCCPANMNSDCSGSPANLGVSDSDSPGNFKPACSGPSANLEVSCSDSPGILKSACSGTPANLEVSSSDSPVNLKSPCSDPPADLEVSSSDSPANQEVSSSDPPADLKSACLPESLSCSDLWSNSQPSCSGALANLRASCSSGCLANVESPYSGSSVNLESSSPVSTQLQADHGHVCALDSDAAKDELQESSNSGLSTPSTVSKCTCKSSRFSRAGTKEKFTGVGKCERRHSAKHSRLKMLKVHSTKAENRLDRNTNALCTDTSDCVDRGKQLTDRGSTSNTLTIAEAGRNMRHCEEEDVLVCEDGTRLEEYLEKADDEYFHQFLLSDKELRMFVVMDVVHPSFRKSSCFTKRYCYFSVVNSVFFLC